jgi:hypothetical protein
MVLYTMLESISTNRDERKVIKKEFFEDYKY